MSASLFPSKLGTVYVRVYYNNAELLSPIERLYCVYNEEGDDTCTLTINVPWKNFAAEGPDGKPIQEGNQLVVNWGYINNMITRKVYINDIKWEFDKNGVKVTLEAHEKAVTTKQTKSKKIYKNKTLPEVAKEVGERHGLKVEYHVPNPPDKAPTSKPEIIDLRAGLEAYQKRVASGGPNDSWPFRPRHNIAQANKTDAHLLQELGMREPDGQWIPETRDDKLIIKKRNFNQLPLRSYEYRNGDGELFSFTPETKNKSKLGTAINSFFSSWDKANKKFLQSQANAITEMKKTYLTQYLKSVGFIPTKSGIQSRDKAIETVVENLLRGDTYGKDNKVVLPRAPSDMEQELFGGKVLPDANDVVGFLPFENSTFGTSGKGSAADNTTRIIRGATPLFGEELKDQIKKAEEAVTNSKHDPLAENLDDAFGPANNPRDRSNLQRNPATALLWGNPQIETGQILSILGVGKKYASNYYIIKSTHTIEQQSGYTTMPEMVRQGENIKAGGNDLSIKKANKAINRELGIDHNSRRNKAVKKVQNRR